MNPTQPNQQPRKPQLPLVEPAPAKDDLRVTMADVERLTVECEEKERALTEVRWKLDEAHTAIAELAGHRDSLEAKLRDAERIATLARAATIGDLASAMTRGSIAAMRFIMPHGQRVAVQCYATPFPATNDIPMLAVNGDNVEDALTCLVGAVRPN